MTTVCAWLLQAVVQEIMGMRSSNRRLLATAAPLDFTSSSTVSSLLTVRQIAAEMLFQPARGWIPGLCVAFNLTHSGRQILCVRPRRVSHNI